MLSFFCFVFSNHFRNKTHWYSNLANITCLTIKCYFYDLVQKTVPYSNRKCVLNANLSNNSTTNYSTNEQSCSLLTNFPPLICFQVLYTVIGHQIYLEAGEYHTVKYQFIFIIPIVFGFNYQVQCQLTVLAVSQPV